MSQTFIGQVLESKNPLPEIMVAEVKRFFILSLFFAFWIIQVYKVVILRIQKLSIREFEENWPINGGAGFWSAQKPLANQEIKDLFVL